MPLFQYSLPSETLSDPFPSPEQILFALSEPLLETGDIKLSLQNLLIKGLGKNLKGLSHLLKEVKKIKTSLLEHYDPLPALESLKKALQEKKGNLASMGLPDRGGASLDSHKKGGSRLLDLSEEKEKIKKASQKSLSPLVAALEELVDKFHFTGSKSFSPEEALSIIERMGLILQVESDFQRAIWGYDLNAIDSRNIKDLLGEEGNQAWEVLKKIKTELTRSGLLEEWASTCRLTQKGFRVLSSKLLKEILDLIKKDLVGKHPSKFSGEGRIDITTSRPYEFGLPFHINLSKTLMNATMRQRRCTPLSLKAEDFEVYDPEHSTRCATVLMLDMSKSMKDRNNFLTAKKVALALNDLIRRKFRRDYLEIIGFSTLARKLLPEELPYILWDADQPYTNIQEGLRLSLRVLRRQGFYNKQVILITDGEPTAHSEDGKLYFQFPPHPRTVEYTLKEVKQCTREGIVIHTFMMAKSNPLTNFVEELTKINQGLAFYADSDSLGKHIIVNYLNRKRK